MSFLKRNYFKLLLSGLVGSSALLVSGMIDSLIAGRYLSAAALTAVSLVSPYYSLSSFLCSVVLSGANISINQSVGSKDMALADRQFSTLFYAQVIIGLGFALVSTLLAPRLPGLLGGGESTSPLMLEYLGGVAPYAFVFPISAFLSSVAYYDGDVRFSVSGQLLSIVANILLSIWLSRRMGIRGVAVATVLSSALACCVYSLHFLLGRCPLHLVRAFSLRELAAMTGVGLPGISAYLFIAVAVAVVNNYIGGRFGEYSLYLFAISNTLVGAFANLTGAAGEALAPMASLYYGEDNQLMLRRLIKLALGCVLVLSVAAALPIYLFPGAICRLYSVSPADVANVSGALRMFAASLFLSGVTNAMVIYYMVSRHTVIAFVCSLLRCLVFFAASFMLLGALAPGYLWFGVSLSEGLTLCAMLAITLIYGRKKKLTPLLLLDRAREDSIRVWDFPSKLESFLACGNQVENTLRAAGYSQKTALDSVLVLEELGGLLIGYRCRVEVTVIMDGRVELVVRDTSPKWDIANEDDALGSFQQYAALRILNGKAKKQFFRTTGCNKVSFIIE